MKIQDTATTHEARCQREVNGRRAASKRTEFKSVGTALEDLAAATLVHRSAA